MNANPLPVVKHLNASEMMKQFMTPIQEYEERFLACDPKVSEAYRFIGLYRLFTHPIMEMFTEATWVWQAIIEAEMSRDNVIIDTVDQFDEYVDNFLHMLKVVNPTFNEKSQTGINLELAFNSIFHAKGFIDEAE